MRLTGQRKYICLLITLMILISGMCFDVIKADACFSSVQASKQTRAVYIDKGDITRQCAYVEEKTEGREGVSRTVVRTGNRKDLASKSLVGFMSVKEITPEKSFNTSKEAACSTRLDHSNSAAIMRYVHHQDGFK